MLPPNQHSTAIEGLVERHLQELTSWIFEKNAEGRTRLGESRNLKQLSEVVANDRARDAFREGSTLEEAHLLSDAPMEIFEQAIYGAKQFLISAREVMHQVTSPTQTDLDRLVDIREIARTLQLSVEEKLSEADD